MLKTKEKSESLVNLIYIWTHSVKYLIWSGMKDSKSNGIIYKILNQNESSSDILA